VRVKWINERGAGTEKEPLIYMLADGIIRPIVHVVTACWYGCCCRLSMLPIIILLFLLDAAQAFLPSVAHGDVFYTACCFSSCKNNIFYLYIFRYGL